MSISGITSALTNNSVKFLSGLSRNESSLVPMVIKDWIGDGATVYTYKKDGGKDDAKEKAIEEFGTGAVWLFGIPIVKKIFDKTAYKALKMNPEFDIRLLKDADRMKFSQDFLEKTDNVALNAEKELFEQLKDANLAKKYKGMHFAKFAVSTALAAVALTKIIKYKQKTTKERIEKDIYARKQLSSATLLNKSNKNDISFTKFTDNAKNNTLSFTGIKELACEFMFNPVRNTSILDGVIATTRLKEARKGERKEILFKEACQIFFIYCMAEPIQKAFEKIGSNLKLPIELDPQILFTKNLGEKIKNSKADMEKLLEAENITQEVLKLDIKSDIVELLDKNDAISTIKQKGDIKAISHLKEIDEDKIKATIENLKKIEPNLANLKGIKAFKIFAVIANVLIVAGIMGIIQPKLNILMRKMLNNGDNRNPAIVEQEKMAELNAHQG